VDVEVVPLEYSAERGSENDLPLFRRHSAAADTAASRCSNRHLFRSPPMLMQVLPRGRTLPESWDLCHGNIAVKPAPIRLSALCNSLAAYQPAPAHCGAQAVINHFASGAHVCLHTKCQARR